MFYEQLPEWVRLIYRRAIWRKDKTKPILYLTFDDGPIPQVTPWILDTLDKFGIKATFFCVGENVYRYPKLFADIQKRGHRVGNHTYHHIRGIKLNSHRYLEDILKADSLIHSNLYRPPHGEMGIMQYRKVKSKFTIIQWDVVSRDYNFNLPPERVLNIVKTKARNGSIVTFHDSLKSEKNLKIVLPRALEWLIKEGFSFDTL